MAEMWLRVFVFVCVFQSLYPQTSVIVGPTFIYGGLTCTAPEAHPLIPEL